MAQYFKDLLGMIIVNRPLEKQPVAAHYIFFLSIIMITSCEDQLNLRPESTNTVKNFYRNEKDIEQALMGAYHALQSNGQYGLNFIYFMEVRSDNAFSRGLNNSGGIYGDVELFRVEPTNAILESTWVSSYQGIQSANAVIHRAPDIDMEAAIRAKLIAEAQFIRALTYFNMARIWGGVPLMLQETQDPFAFVKLPRSSVEEVYAQIEKDIEEAIPALPGENENNTGRVTSWAAKALLAKVYLTLKDYAEAEKQLKDIIDNGPFSLLPSYAEIFSVNDENNAEVIFSIQYQSGLDGEGSGYAN